MKHTAIGGIVAGMVISGAANALSLPPGGADLNDDNILGVPCEGQALWVNNIDKCHRKSKSRSGKPRFNSVWDQRYESGNSKLNDDRRNNDPVCYQMTRSMRSCYGGTRHKVFP